MPKTQIETSFDGLSVHRVQKAYEQVALQLRQLILGGRLVDGARLPPELLLAQNFGVSRATVREALKTLAAESLIRTTKGSVGGSFVTRPSLRTVSSFLNSSINLLTEAQDVSLKELLEARELLEVPAARLAAERRCEGDVQHLRAAMPTNASELPVQTQFAHNKDFHTAVIEAGKNSLLTLAAQPIFLALQTHLARSSLGTAFHETVNDHHHAITIAIENRAPRRAEREMRTHLEFLRPFYERMWREVVSASDQLSL